MRCRQGAGFAPLRRSLVASVLVAAFASMPAGAAEPAPSRVLFVGNSYLTTNNLPLRASQLAGQRGQALDAVMHARPDFSLADHLRDRTVLDARGTPWDWVVLQQGPSSLPASGDDLVASARAMALRLQGRPTRIALFAAWPAADRADASLQGEANYRRAAEAIGACLLPVAAAWRLARADAAMPRLYQADRLHPSRSGTRLAALVVLRGLLGRAPADGEDAMERIVTAAYAQEPLACRPD